MRIALITDEYLPESTRIHAKMMHELALEFRRLGHEVIVITPKIGKVTRDNQIEQVDSIDVYRFPSGIIRSKSKVVRAINETLLSFRAWFSLSSLIRKKKIDAVIYYSPSIFWGFLVYKIKKHWNCPTYLVLRDLFPQWAIDAGMIKEGSLIARYFRFWEKLNYSVADHIGLMSPENIKIFNQTYPQYENTSVLYNWADTTKSLPDSSGMRYREQLNLMDKVIFFYGGNIGHAQDMSNLLRLAIAMKPYSEAHFLFVGQGDEVDLVKQTIAEKALTNCTYLPSISQNEFKRLLHDVDVGLFSLSRSHTAHNFPGKLLGYMVNSIPILGSVNPDNDLLELINQYHAGRVFINGDDDVLLSTALELLKDKSLRQRLGENGYTLLLEHFSVESAAENIMGKL